MATSLRYVVQVQKPTQLNFRAWSIPHRLSLTPSNRQIGFYNWLTWFKTKSLEICRNKCSRIGHGIYGLGSSSSQNYVGSMYLAWFNSPCFLKGLTLPPCLTPSTCPLLKIEGKYRQCCHHSQGEAGQKHLDLNLLRLLTAGWFCCYDKYWYAKWIQNGRPQTLFLSEENQQEGHQQ